MSDSSELNVLTFLAPHLQVLLGAWQLLVHCHCVALQTDVTTGVSVDARGAAGAGHASAVGCYSCLLPVRVNIAEAESFRDLLSLLSGPTRRAFASPTVPFVGALAAVKRLSPMPSINLRSDIDDSLSATPSAIAANWTSSN